MDFTAMALEMFKAILMVEGISWIVYWIATFLKWVCGALVRGTRKRLGENAIDLLKALKLFLHRCVCSVEEVGRNKLKDVIGCHQVILSCCIVLLPSMWSQAIITFEGKNALRVLGAENVSDIEAVLTIWCVQLAASYLALFRCKKIIKSIVFSFLIPMAYAMGGGNIKLATLIYSIVLLVIGFFRSDNNEESDWGGGLLLPIYVILPLFLFKVAEFVSNTALINSGIECGNLDILKIADWLIWYCMRGQQKIIGEVFSLVFIMLIGYWLAKLLICLPVCIQCDTCCAIVKDQTMVFHFDGVICALDCKCKDVITRLGKRVRRIEGTCERLWNVVEKTWKESWEAIYKKSEDKQE